MMTENFLLKLIIYQGRDWKLTEDASVYIRASLGKNVAGTTPTGYASSCPKFNAELCWEVDRKTLRGLKMNRLPIKVEFITDNQSCQKLLGYVILPLSIAAERIEVQAQWYKLLGGKFGSQKESPHILMALSLTDADLEEKEQSSEEEAWQEDDDIEEVFDNEAKMAHTNGYISNHQGNAEAGGQNGNAYITDDHNDQIEEEELEDEEAVHQNESLESCEPEDDEEGLYDDLSDVNPEDEFAEALSDKEEGSCSENSICSEDLNNQFEETASSGLRSEQSFDNKNVDLPKKNSANVPPAVIPAKLDDRKPCEGSQLLDSRSQVKDQLRRLSKEHSISKLGNSSRSMPEMDASSFLRKLPLSTPDSPITGNKRNLESPDLVHSAAKVRKIDTFNNNESSLNATIGRPVASTNVFRQRNNKLDPSHRQANNISGILEKSSNAALAKNTSPSIVDILLSTSGAVSEKSTTRPIAEEPCRAELSEDNGFFRILPTDSEDQRKYMFSVTIVYAKNLQHVISEELWKKLKQDGIQFKYCLFGCSVFTDPFFTIEGHILLSERGTATVSSSETQLSKYFSENSFLSVDLISGNMVIANCTVDLEKLRSVDYLQQVTIEGAYDLSVGPAFSKHVKTDTAIVGVCVELCEEKCNNKRDQIYVTKKSHKLRETKYENYQNRSRSSSQYGRHSLPQLSESSSSSESDSEEEMLDKIVARLKAGKSKTKRKKLMHSMRKGKREYLQEAALEVERWKEDQKQAFLLKWSSREESLQKHLASEWSSKVKIFEGILEQRLTGCGHLQDKLSEALEKVSIQDNKLRDKEIKVNQMEKELRIELNKVKNNQHGEAMKSTIAENKKIELLENEVKKLREQQRCSEKSSKDEMQEIFSLRKKLLEAGDIRILKRENERLIEQVALTEEKKEYYKQQWTAAIANLHSMQSATKHNNTVHMPGTRKSPNDSSNFGLKIRHLIEERKALTESGLYPHSHPMVREIDKKIKCLINSIQNT